MHNILILTNFMDLELQEPSVIGNNSINYIL